jgi:hypothetical protein
MTKNIKALPWFQEYEQDIIMFIVYINPKAMVVLKNFVSHLTVFLNT